MSDLTDIRLPAGQSEGSTHEVGSWLKRVGDQVRKDEPLLEVITDKVTVEIAAPAGGVLAEILKQPGESVEKGAVLGRIRAGPATADTAPVSTVPRAGSTERLPPPRPPIRLS